MVNASFNETKRLNLIRIMKEKNIKSGDLANLIERDPPYINSILKPTGERGSRGIGSKILKVLCAKLQMSEDEFFIGMGIPAPEKKQKAIPVISWVHAGVFAECEDRWPSEVSGVEDPVFSYVKTGPNAFGLRVEGDSMLPRFMPGDIAIVDPALRCDNGSPCVVSVNGEVQLRFMWDKETEISLKSMNDKYPEIVIKKDSKVDFKVIGKVVDIKVKF
ncbi:MAG: LexA family transcriptional regulator [Syntrophales bacterium]